MFLLKHIFIYVGNGSIQMLLYLNFINIQGPCILIIRKTSLRPIFIANIAAIFFSFGIESSVKNVKIPHLYLILTYSRIYIFEKGFLLYLEEHL